MARLRVLEREVSVKEADLAFRVSQANRSAWSSPLVVAILAAAIGALTNAGVTYYNSMQSAFQAKNGAENERILEMIKVADPSQVQRNLEFLIATNLVRNVETVQSISDYYNSQEPGVGPGASAPAAQPVQFERNSDPLLLHPNFRAAVLDIQKALNSEGIPFKIFEGFRSPEKQAQLYAQGRTTPGSKVTHAPPWSTLHNYGLAVDFVLFIDDSWTWDTSGLKAEYWKRLQEVALEKGLRLGYVDLPHVEAMVDISELVKGNYPSGGDQTWYENLFSAIEVSESSVKPSPPKQ